MEINVTKVQYQDKEITLIPTAHVSKDSALFTETVIDEIKPDSICIELDEDRYQSITDPDKFKQTDIVKIIKEKRVAILLVNLILSNYQKKLAGKLDSQSGNEMLVGINKAQQLNANLVLADRKIQTTFKRVWANQTFVDKVKLISAIVDAAFDDEEISEEDLLQLQQSDMLTSALSEVTEKFPHIAEVLVEERDKYLAYKIKNAPGKNIVAILGAAHTINIPRYIQEDYSIEQYDVIPEKKLSQKIVKWIIPVAVLVAIICAFRIDPNVGLNQIKSWIVINGSLAALGALLAGGSIISILVSFVMAPITSLNPFLASGWFAGLAEAKISKPTVADFERLSDDCSTLKGFRTNKVSKILLIVILSNVGSTIGSFVSGFDIIKQLFNL